MESVVQIKAILERIQFRKGAVLPQGIEDEMEPPEALAQVMRLDPHERLLVRVDEEAPFVRLNAGVVLEVPTAEALYRIAGTADAITPASDGMPIVALAVEHAEVIQRRKDTRYEVNFPCRFALVDAGERPTDVLLHPEGSGRVTDISLGGIAFETESTLPLGAMIKIDVRLPGGRTDLTGQVVKALREEFTVREYGVRIDAADTVSMNRLHRLVARLEKEERRRKEMPAALRPPADRFGSGLRRVRGMSRRRVRRFY